VVTLVGLAAQPVRAVGHRDGADGEPLHLRGVPEVRADAQRRLLLQGQLVQHGLSILSTTSHIL
jgi:hypothetical protein